MLSEGREAVSRDREKELSNTTITESTVIDITLVLYTSHLYCILLFCLHDLWIIFITRTFGIGSRTAEVQTVSGRCWSDRDTKIVNSVSHSWRLRPTVRLLLAMHWYRRIYGTVSAGFGRKQLFSKRDKRDEGPRVAHVTQAPGWPYADKERFHTCTICCWENMVCSALLLQCHRTVTVLQHCYCSVTDCYNNSVTAVLQQCYLK